MHPVSQGPVSFWYSIFFFVITTPLGLSREEFLFCPDGCVCGAYTAAGTEQHILCGQRAGFARKVLLKELDMNSMNEEEKALKQAMEAVFYARDPEGELPPNLLIVEKSFSPPDSEEEEERDRDPGLRYY